MLGQVFSLLSYPKPTNIFTFSTQNIQYFIQNIQWKWQKIKIAKYWKKKRISNILIYFLALVSKYISNIFIFSTKIFNILFIEIFKIFSENRKKSESQNIAKTYFFKYFNIFVGSCHMFSIIRALFTEHWRQKWGTTKIVWSDKATLIFTTRLLLSAQQATLCLEKNQVINSCLFETFFLAKNQNRWLGKETPLLRISRTLDFFYVMKIRFLTVDVIK